MRRINRRQEIITSAFIIQELADPHAYDDGRSESRVLRLPELDDEYRQHRSYLRRIGREAKQSFMGSYRLNSIRKAR